MDDGFVGLIFSVFNEDKVTKVSPTEASQTCTPTGLLIKVQGSIIARSIVFSEVRIKCLMLDTRMIKNNGIIINTHGLSMPKKKCYDFLKIFEGTDELYGKIMI